MLEIESDEEEVVVEVQDEEVDPKSVLDAFFDTSNEVSNKLTVVQTEISGLAFFWNSAAIFEKKKK